MCGGFLGILIDGTAECEAHAIHGICKICAYQISWALICSKRGVPSATAENDQREIRKEMTCPQCQNTIQDGFYCTKCGYVPGWPIAPWNERR
jgi:hypothetical protein